jgi:hypothetical protein
VKNTTIPEDRSNKWNLMVDIEQVKKYDASRLQNIYQEVRLKEDIILKTEMNMQHQSIYDDSYKPLFINEMNQDAIKEFSNILSQKLRHVKLAISKATMSQNKYAHFQEMSDQKRMRDIKSIIEDVHGISQHDRLKSKMNRKSVIKPYIHQDDYSKKEDLTPTQRFDYLQLEFDKQIWGLHQQLPSVGKKSRVSPLKKLKSEEALDSYRYFLNKD